VFRACDWDSSGHVSLPELQVVIKQSGATLRAEDVEAVFVDLRAAADGTSGASGASGSIDFSEFVRGFSGMFSGLGGGEPAGLAALATARS